MTRFYDESTMLLGPRESDGPSNMPRPRYPNTVTLQGCYTRHSDASLRSAVTRIVSVSLILSGNLSTLNPARSVDIRRRALLAFNRLAEQDPDILKDIASKARKRVADPEPVVVMAALSLCETLARVRL